jgi:hypothetical protein
MDGFNYFNYFTEIEEHFWRKRGAHLLVSPLDWAVVETWQKAGIPLEAVLKGIDRAFESYGRSRRGQAGRPLKSLVYCVDAVLEAAEEAREAAAGKGPESAKRRTGDAFSEAELRAYLARNAAKLRGAAKASREKDAGLAARFEEAAGRLEELERRLSPGAGGGVDLEELERALTVLEEKLTASLVASAPDETLVEIRREIDRAVSPYRRKMTAEQLSLLERQYTQKRLFEKFNLPRLSLFYLA